MNRAVRRRRRFLWASGVLCFGIAIAIVSTRASALPSDQRDPATRSPQRAQIVPPPHPATHTVPFLDGEKDPSLIPDDVANRLFLRMLMMSKMSQSAEKMQRSYIRQVLRIGAVLADPSHASHKNENCNAHKDATPSEAEVDAVVRLIRSYEPRWRTIDRTRRALREKGDIVGARAYLKDRDALVKEVLASLPARVGEPNTLKLSLYVQKRFKKSTKIFNPAGDPRRHTLEENAHDSAHSYAPR